VVKKLRKKYLKPETKKNSELNSKSLLRNEIKRCNKNLFVFASIFTIIAAIIAAYLFPDFDILGKTIILILFFSLPSYNYYLLYIRLKDYKNHPIYKHAIILGDPQEVSNLLESSMEKKKLYNGKSIIIIPDWIIERKIFKFIFVHSTEIYWVYKVQTKHSINFIPTGSTYSIKIHTTYIKEMEIEKDCNEKETDNLLKIIYSIAPWAIYGFSYELKTLDEINPIKIIDAVNLRKKEILSN